MQQTGFQNLPFFISIPHSGEKVPDQCTWLKNLSEPILMCDVDRYVDRLYKPAMQDFKIPFVETEWHRFAADLNRLPEDVDAGSVQGHANAKGKFSRGFHPQITTRKDVLMTGPMSVKAHQELVDLIYTPFHAQIRQKYDEFRQRGFSQVYHLDVHSCPSVGTSEHKDPGQRRADIIVSDSKGVSSSSQFVDLVIASYVRAGFKVGYNWPYVGGRVTEQYGQPKQGQHTVQVELNRGLYMNEENKQILPEHKQVQEQMRLALGYLELGLQSIVARG